MLFTKLGSLYKSLALNGELWKLNRIQSSLRGFVLLHSASNIPDTDGQIGGPIRLKSSGGVFESIHKRVLHTFKAPQTLC